MKIAVLCKLLFSHDKCMQSQILDWGACQMSLKPLLLQTVKWWRCSTQLKIKLQTCIAQALFDRQPCNLRSHMRLLMTNNFAFGTYDLWPLELQQYSIIWKTVKSNIIVGFSHKVHETFYTWTLDLYGQNLQKKLLQVKKCSFYEQMKI